MQRLTGKIQIIFAGAVKGVSHQRMAQIGHMYPDVVGAAGFQTALNKRMAVESFLYILMGTGIFAVF